MEIKEALQLVGLRQAEAAVYLDILTHQGSATGSICKRTGIASSHIYTILANLMDRGLVTYKPVNNRKIFSAEDPGNLQKLYKEKIELLSAQQQQVQAQIELLKRLPKAEDKREDFRYFQGLRGVKSLYREIMGHWKRGDSYCVASAPQASFKKGEGFFIGEVHKKRIEDGVGLRIIINEESREFGKAREKMPRTEVRYMRLQTMCEYGVLRDWMFLAAYGEHPYGLLIKDAAFAGTFLGFFEVLWQQARP